MSLYVYNSVGHSSSSEVVSQIEVWGGGRGRNWVDATPLGVKISDLVLHRLFLD